MDKIKKFLELTGFNTIWLTLAACAVIYSYAYYCEYFSAANFLILVFGLVCLHLGVNLHSDYKYIKNKLSLGENLSGIKFNTIYPRGRLILDGTYSMKKVKFIDHVLFIIAISVGICFSIVNWPILLFIAAGVVLALLYPIAPKNTLREFIAALGFGPLVIMGGHYAITLQYEPNLLLMSFAVFFVNLVFLHVQNIMDWELSEKSPSLLAISKKTALEMLTILLIIPYVIIVLGVIAGRFDPYVLYSFLTLPIATKLIHSMKEYIEVKDVKFQPRWYWGLFENWKLIQEKRIDFYMFRYYLARNLAFFFALLAAIGTFC